MIKSRVAVLKTFQRLFFRTPLVHVFVFAPLLHDFLWWLTEGKRIQGSVSKDMKWGRLFHEYQS